VETEEPTVAAFVLLGLLPLAEDVLEAVCELLVSLVVLDATLAVPEPESRTAVFKQLVSLPETILAMAEKAWAPVLSLITALKLVLAWRSTSQEKEVPCCSGNCLIGVGSAADKIRDKK